MGVKVVSPTPRRHDTHAGGAGTVNEQIGEAYEGQVLSVLAGPERDAKGNRWFKVKGPNGTGWIVAGFLEGQAGTAPATKPSTKATTDTSKQAAKPASSATKLVGFGKVANTDGDPLRVRNAANREGSVLTKLAPNTVVAVKKGPVTDDEGIVWYQVSANGVTGWAMAHYLGSPGVPEVTASQTESKPAEAPAARPISFCRQPAAIRPPSPVGIADTIVSTAWLRRLSLSLRAPPLRLRL